MRISKTLVAVMLAALFLGSATAYWKVPLTKTAVVQEGTSFVQDQVHNSLIEIGKGDNSKHVRATFDSTILFNWFFDSETSIVTAAGAASTLRNNYYECKTPCKYTVVNGVFQTFTTTQNNNAPLKINGDRLVFKGQTTNNVIGRNATTKANIAHKELSDIHFLVPNVVQEQDVKLFFKDSQVASFGLGRPDYVVLRQKNFGDFLNSTAVRIPQLGFSLYIHDTLSQIMFGEPELFFAAKAPLTRIRNLARSRLWESRLVKLTINKHVVVGSDSPRDCIENNYDVTPAAPQTYNFPTSLPCDSTTPDNGRANPTVIFDTTTRYVIAPKVQLDKLFTQIRSVNSENVITASTEHVGYYEAVCREDTYKTKFPTIELFFYEHAAEPFTLKPEDYIRYDATKTNDKKCWLLFKDNTLEEPKDKLNWYLGTTFLANNYCHFNQVDNSVSCAPAHRFTPGQKTIDDTSRIIALIVGGLILLAALAIILSLFTKVPPFQPSSAPSQSQVSKSTGLGRTVIETHTPAPLKASSSGINTSTNNNNNIYNSRFPPAANPYY